MNKFIYNKINSRLNFNSSNYIIKLYNSRMLKNTEYTIIELESWLNKVDGNYPKNKTELKYLGLFMTKIKIITPSISCLINLTSLNLSDNNLSDITALSNLIKLTEIYLNNNKISNISALSNLTNLKQINLNNNKISDISALSKLIKLTEIYLNNNKISNISALSNLVRLKRINISHNNISDISPLIGLPKLSTLTMVHIKIIYDGKLIDNKELELLFKNVKFLYYSNYDWANQI